MDRHTKSDASNINNDNAAQSPAQTSQDVSSSLFSHTILAYWDNIMGPMILKRWEGNGKVAVGDELISYVSNHTLSGELCRKTNSSSIDPKFYVLADAGYIFFAVIFTGAGDTVSSLSFIMAYEDLDRFLHLQEIILAKIRLITVKYIVLQQKDAKRAVYQLEVFLKNMSRSISLLEEFQMPENICICNTLFGETSNTRHDYELLEPKFLARCVTSHLQTAGCTIVVGKSESRINAVLLTLGLFLTVNERKCSRMASALSQSLSSCHFTSELKLQGIVLSPATSFLSDNAPISSEDVILSSFPVTLIDVDMKIIRQSPDIHKHLSTRRDFIKMMMSLSLQGEKPHQYPASTLLSEEISDISPIVQEMMNEMNILPKKCSIRQSHVDNFKSSLEIKTKGMIAIVEMLTKRGTVRLDPSKLKDLKQTTNLCKEADFKVLLAAAEKIVPRITSAMFGDVNREREHRVILENF